MTLEVYSMDNSKSTPRREVLPKIVHLGGTIHPKRKKPTDTWMPVQPDQVISGVTNHVTSHTTGRSRKFKNLFEYNKQYNDKFNLKRSLWKIPSMGNNFLPFKQKNDPDSAEEVVGLYRPNFRKWYSRLTHENTLIETPTETSLRIRDLVHDPNNLHEKKYILEQMKETGQRERFVRDEIHLPDIYPQCYTCAECKRQYASDVYIQTWKKRNDVTTSCATSTRNGESGKRTLRKKQHCDVLGERYCRSCIERRNKNFSVQIENSITGAKKVNSIHYKSPTI